MKTIILLGFLVICLNGHSFETDIGKPKTFKPKRDYSIIVSDEGYYPEKITIFEGETLNIFLTSTAEEKGCLMIPSHDIFVAANKGRITSTSAKFKNPGTYEFYCPNNMIKGEIVVLQRKRERPKRMPASETKTKIWMPKDY